MFGAISHRGTVSSILEIAGNLTLITKPPDKYNSLKSESFV